MSKKATAELRVRLDHTLFAAVKQAAAASRQTPSEIVGDAIAFAHDLGPRLATLMERIEIVIERHDEICAALGDIADYVASAGSDEDEGPPAAAHLQ